MMLDFLTKKLYISKIRDSATIPSKRDEDGWYDLYACFAEREMYILPHTTVLVPTGIRSVIPKGYRVVLEERGSNSKWCGMLQAGCIDSGYRGEWFVAIHNGNDIPVEITKTVHTVFKTEDYISFPYDKAVCQFKVEKIPKIEIVEVDEDFVNSKESERMSGSLGSSGK